MRANRGLKLAQSAGADEDVCKTSVTTSATKILFT